MRSVVASFFERFFFSATDAASRFVISRWLFLRALGCIYLAAFLSLSVQIHGLIGSEGILPVRVFLNAVPETDGWKRFLAAPTLCWLNTSDHYLTALCIAGVILAVFLIVGLAQIPVLFLLWVTYLSLAIAGQVFLGYQWDTLLLETGFLAIFIAPWQVGPRLGTQSPPSRVVLWLFRWLLFRLMFSSGAVKLMSGDPTWHDLTALQYHYETQPLPPWTAWYMHQLPGWFQQLSVLVTFIAELFLPLFIFLPRPFRHTAFFGMAGFQVLIMLTGNYGCFNLLAIALCLPLLDDEFYPSRLRALFDRSAKAAPEVQARRWREWLYAALAVGIVSMSLVPVTAGIIDPIHWPRAILDAYRVARSFESVNSYGLFAVMTTTRNEIIIEGSDDGVVWHAYEFKWKPGDLMRRPAFVTPHLPRLDWQMWFAALGSRADDPWFRVLLYRLLHGSPPVLALFEHNPFPDRPPVYVRSMLYRYHFTSSAERQASGAWWRRELLGPYSPVISIRTPDPH
jgi:hypothetical protein